MDSFDVVKYFILRFVSFNRLISDKSIIQSRRAYSAKLNDLRNENRMKLSQNDNYGVKIYTFVFHVFSKHMQYSAINVLVHLVKKKFKNSVM